MTAYRFSPNARVSRKKLLDGTGRIQNPCRIPLTKRRFFIDYASFDPGVASNASNRKLRNLIKFCTTRDEKDLPAFQAHQKTPARFPCPDENKERARYHSPSPPKRPEASDSKRCRDPIQAAYSATLGLAPSAAPRNSCGSDLDRTDKRDNGLGTD